MVRPYMTVTRRHGRISAAARAADWPRLRRAAYVLGAAILPPLRLRRILRVLPPQQREQMPRRAMALLVAGLVADALGQATGFASAASGDERAALACLELDRVRFVPDDEWITPR
jgi:hypothetical protein